MQANVKVDFDKEKAKEKLEKRKAVAQAKLDAQVLKDSNFYIPFDTGSLKQSGILHTKIGSGKVIWDTPYAKKQYYNFPNKRVDRNPNASGKWFEMAKAKKIKRWGKLVDKVMKDEGNN